VPVTERAGVPTVMVAVAFEPPGVAVTESVMLPLAVPVPTVMVIVNVVVLPVR
jgi:hypothetical protein